MYIIIFIIDKTYIDAQIKLAEIYFMKFDDKKKEEINILKNAIQYALDLTPYRFESHLTTLPKTKPFQHIRQFIVKRMLGFIINHLNNIADLSGLQYVCWDKKNILLCYNDYF